MKPTYEELAQRVETLEREAADLRQCELSLRESERRYRTLLDFAPYPVATFTLKGKISYLNPAFTRVFGWTLAEMKSGKARFVPSELAPETSEKLRELFQERTVTRYVTQRLCKDGRKVDVIARGAIFSEEEMGVAGELVIFRDITRERRIAGINETLLRISMALPEYPDLEELLDYITFEIKRLLNTQGALVILLDEEKQEFFFPGAAYDEEATDKKVKEIRLPMDSMASGQVVREGKPLIINDAYKDAARYARRDREFGFAFNNYVLVPIRAGERIIGVLAAYNKNDGLFEPPDMELLEMIAATVGLSIENARFSDALKKSHRELASLDRAKTKAINHLSHELKTPVSIFGGTLGILEKKLAKLPEKSWKKSMDRAQRNLERIRHLQSEINDIILEKEFPSRPLFSVMAGRFADLVEEAVETGPEIPGLMDRVRARLDDLFDITPSPSEQIRLDEFAADRLERLRPRFSHRDLEIHAILEPGAVIHMPPGTLQKTVDGLIRNAVENTPDQGKIEIGVTAGKVPGLTVKDHGIGIVSEHRKRIFEGFFSTQATQAYSTGAAFDFNAGGRGADLLRMKIFSERYHFDIRLETRRCRFIPKATDVCPGRIADCRHCTGPQTCIDSGGSAFIVRFGGPRADGVSEPGHES